MIRFLALGDSYTIGEGVAEEHRWPVQLSASLRTHGLRIAEPEVIAKTGWTTDELSDAIEKAKPTGDYGLVSLLIGVNNQYRGRSEEEYRSQFRSLLARAVVFAGNDAGRVIVISIPDWGVTPFAEGRDRQQISREIDRFNQINRDETSRSGARYVDITPGSRAAGTDPALIAGDGLHPSGKMYTSWARQALPTAMAALGASGGASPTRVTQ
ncbi:MAG: SGNH/GDSL hydrolase family protein [Gemmatimonadaceae bacterium]